MSNHSTDHAYYQFMVCKIGIHSSSHVRLSLKVLIDNIDFPCFKERKILRSK